MLVINFLSMTVVLLLFFLPFNIKLYCLAAVTLRIIGNVTKRMIIANASCLSTMNKPVVSLVYMKERISPMVVYKPVLMSKVEMSINKAPDTAIVGTFHLAKRVPVK